MFNAGLDKDLVLAAEERCSLSLPKPSKAGRFLMMSDVPFVYGSLVHVCWTSKPTQAAVRKAQSQKTFKQRDRRMWGDEPFVCIDLPATLSQARKLQAILAGARIAPNWYRADVEVLKVLSRYCDRFAPGTAYVRFT